MGRDHGVLQRRPISIASQATTYIGKESNQIKEVEAGIHQDLQEILNEYQDPDTDDWRDIYRPALQLLKEQGVISDIEVADSLAMNRSTPYRWRTGQARPTTKQTAGLGEFIAPLIAEPSNPTPFRDHKIRIIVWLERNL